MRAGHLVYVAAAAGWLGCGGRTPTTTIGSKAAAADPPVCVLLERAGSWQTELIPSCPPDPLPAIGICEPGACARPCAVRFSDLDGSEAVTARYRHDDAGHVVEIVRAEIRTACTWRDGQLDECVSGDVRERAVRDAGGTITAIEDGTGRHEVVREGGRIVAFDGAAVRYRDDGRIVAVGDRTIEYDAAGRIVAESDDYTEEARTYGDRGRIDTITTRLRSPPEPGAGEDDSLHELTETFEYDDQGRLVRVVHERAHESTSDVTYYDYDCE